jgi:alpha-1,2-mannosyltransferase
MTTLPAQRKSWQRWATWGFCLLIFVAINADVARTPTKHNTTPTYRLASAQWWAGQDVYSTNAHAGFLYFPQAAVLFTPFTWGPLLLGEFLWRAVAFGLFLYALARLHDFFLATGRRSTANSFLILMLLAVPSSFASLRNAQFDLPLAALIVLASAEIAAERWTAAAVWLCLAVALKPLAVVPLLLFGAIYGKLIPRVAAGLLIVMALPFLHWNPAFVAHEYVRCFQTLVWASKGDEPRYSDLAALLSHFGYAAPELLKTILRVLFALAYLGVAFMGGRRLSLPDAAWLTGALSADYLMLFNPRTETCSYVFLGPFVASLALFWARRAGGKWIGYGLGFAALGLACDAVPKIGSVSIHDMTDRWFKPLIALIFLPVLIRFVWDAQNARRKDGIASE